MLIYPKIPNAIGCPLIKCVAFEKIDGTLIHWSWSLRHGGFYSFGTRRDVFPVTDDGFAAFAAAHPGLEGVRETAGGFAPLGERFRQLHLPVEAEITAFAEYVGPRSFAGQHVSSDSKRLVLFDVAYDGIMLDPEEFIRSFSETCPTPRVVYWGRYSGRLIEEVRAGAYDVTEGVVVKGVVADVVHMAKIKTDAYRDRLHTAFKYRWREYWE